MEPGITMANVRLSPTMPNPPVTARQFGLLVALDSEGEVVWYYRPSHWAESFNMLDDGKIAYLTAEHEIFEIDMLGNLHASWYADGRVTGPGQGLPVHTLALHHSMLVLPNGNFLALGATLRTIPDFYTSTTDPFAPRQTQPVMADEVLEIGRDGQLAFRWDAFDHLDHYRIGHSVFSQTWPQEGFPGARDWTHGNRLSTDGDGILVGMRAQSAIVKIDRATGEIRWILSDPSDWKEPWKSLVLAPDGDVEWPYYQHGPHVTPQGTLLVYNNDIHGSSAFQPRSNPADARSGAIEYAIDEDTMTVRQVWSSEIPGDPPVIGWALGDAEWLPEEQNVLVSDGLVLPMGAGQVSPSWATVLAQTPAWARIREYTHTTPPELVWEVVMQDDSAQTPNGFGTQYARRLPRLHPAIRELQAED